MRRPFADSGAVLAAGVLIVAPAAPVPLTITSEIALLKLGARGVRPRRLAKAVRIEVASERRR